MPDTTSNESANYPPGLYLVATPIGNLRDITLRAVDTLKAADVIYCEDTRVSGKLLQEYNISTPLQSYHDHNAERIRPQIIEYIKSGQCIALISDAGTPLVSDPGYKLVRSAYDHDLDVTSCPGANAPLTALQLSGLPSDSFAFCGFPPSKSSARQTWLKSWRTLDTSLIFFERASRVADALADMIDIFGDRPAAVVREMTKKFETAERGPLSVLEQKYSEKAPRGEIAIVVSGQPADKQASTGDMNAMLSEALETMSVRDAAAYVAEATGLSKRDVYEAALMINKG